MSSDLHLWASSMRRIQSRRSLGRRACDPWRHPLRSLNLRPLLPLRILGATGEEAGLSGEFHRHGSIKIKQVPTTEGPVYGDWPGGEHAPTG